MENSFLEEMTGVFKDILDTDKNKIVIVDAATEVPIEGVKYDKVFFDAELNMYKTNDEGKMVPITNPKVKAIIRS